MSGHVKSLLCQALTGLALCGISLSVLPSHAVVMRSVVSFQPQADRQSEQGDLQGDRQGYDKPQGRERTNGADLRHPGGASVLQRENNKKSPGVFLPTARNMTGHPSRKFRFCGGQGEGGRGLGRLCRGFVPVVPSSLLQCHYPGGM